MPESVARNDTTTSNVERISVTIRVKSPRRHPVQYASSIKKYADSNPPMTKTNTAASNNPRYGRNLNIGTLSPINIIIFHPISAISAVSCDKAIIIPSLFYFFTTLKCSVKTTFLYKTKIHGVKCFSKMSGLCAHQRVATPTGIEPVFLILPIKMCFYWCF